MQFNGKKKWKIELQVDGENVRGIMKASLFRQSNDFLWLMLTSSLSLPIHTELIDKR